jgi:hypothetical protein
MLEHIVKPSIRNILYYRVVGSTILEKISIQYVQENVITPVNHSLDFHCYSCLISDFLFTSIIIYTLTMRFNREQTKINNISTFSDVKTKVEQILWIIFFILTKNVQSAV